MKITMKFLKDLSRNNNREWFNDNKPQFKEAEDELKGLIADVEAEINKNDVLEPGGTKIFRIYRDVRFSKDKTPYNIHRSASFKRSGEERRGGYYVRITPGASMIAGGFWGPEPKDLLHIRKQIQQEPDMLRSILDKKDFNSYFSGLEGDQVKTAPKGFDKEDPAIDLLKFKQFILTHSFTDAEVQSADFAKKLADGFHKMRPFHDYMSEILTTDLNGASML